MAPSLLLPFCSLLLLHWGASGVALVSLLGLEGPWDFPLDYAWTEYFLTPIRAEVGSYIPRGGSLPSSWGHFMTLEEGVISEGQIRGAYFQN